MSRAFDVLLLVLIGFVAWKLVRADDHLALAQDGHQPVTARVRVSGDEPLQGLGLLLTPVDSTQSMGTEGDSPESNTTPHQLAPFYRDRTTQIIAPAPGSYRVRWGVQDQGPAPRRPRSVTLELEPAAKLADQIIELGESSDAGEIVIELPPAHAAGLRALAQ